MAFKSEVATIWAFRHVDEIDSQLSYGGANESIELAQLLDLNASRNKRSPILGLSWRGTFLIGMIRCQRW